MIKYEYIIEAQDFLVKHWKEDGKKVIETIFNENKKNMSMDEFMTHCTACGGNWVGMLLSGVKKVYPKVYDAFPNDMELLTWNAICCTLLLLGVDDSEEV